MSKATKLQLCLACSFIFLAKHVLLVLQLVRKGGFRKLYMPVWSWAEIKKARPIYPVKVAWARKLFDMFGGVVRYSTDITLKLPAQQDFLLQICSCLAGMS